MENLLQKRKFGRCVSAKMFRVENFVGAPRTGMSLYDLY
jgi:hypothetical protein